MDHDGIRLLLISDIHCLGTSRTGFSYLAGDNRTTKETLKLLDNILSKYWGSVDYVLISGDVTDSGKDHQYVAALSVLDNYDPERIAVIPGNHDLANVNSTQSWHWKMRKFKKHMEKYLTPGPEPVDSNQYFPYVRRLKEGFTLFGVDSTLRQTALGIISDRQLRALAEMLDDPAYENDHKIVMLHHDVTGSVKSFSGFNIGYGNILKNKDDFLDVIRGHVAKSGRRDVTVIFGHTHVKRVEPDFMDNVNFACVPSLGGIYNEDFIRLDILGDGTMVEIEDDEGRKPKKRLVVKIQNFLSTAIPLKLNS